MRLSPLLKMAAPSSKILEGVFGEANSSLKTIFFHWATP
jgi:hypothetical protein